MPLSRRLALATAALTLALASPAAAQTFTVTTTEDGPAACTPAACTLRAAIVAANADAAADVIALGPGEYVLPLGELAVTKNATIRGAGTDATRIAAGPNARILTNAAATTTTLEQLTLTGADRSGNPPSNGGAVSNDGTLTLDHVAVVDNRLVSTGPAAVGGGGVFSSGPLTIRDSRIATNSVLAPGGSIPQGGGVYATAPVVIERSSVTDNEVAAAGVGGIPQGAGIAVMAGGALTVTASRIERNRSSGGSIPQGGGIATVGADVSLTDTTVSGNLARAPSAGSIAQAAAIYSVNNAVTITRSAITDNVSQQEGGLGGGGVADGPIFKSGGTLALTSSTVAANRSSGDIVTSSAITTLGGGAVLSVVGSTIAGNTTSGTGNGAAIHVFAPATGTVTNTILADNTSNGALLNCEATNRPTSAGHNLTDDASCSFAGLGDKLGDPRLGPLGANGGPTPTRALLAGSPAIDAGDPTACATTDQRGIGRNGTCDIGAYEFVPPPIPPSPPAPPAPVAPTAKPLPALKAASVLRLPSSKACLSRRQLRVTLRLPAGARAKDVVVTIGKRRLPAFAGKRLKAPIDLRGLPKGTFKVSVRLRTLDGRTATLTRTYRTCAARRKR